MFSIFDKKKTLFQKTKIVIHAVKNYFAKNPSIWWYIASLTIFLVNAKYVTYPDEFVNLLGGKYLLSGKAAYREFFDHHLPFAWFLSAFMLVLSRGSYVGFRLLWAILQWLLLAAVGRHIERKDGKLFSFYRFFMMLYPLVTMYYWTHLFLADSLAVLFLSVSLWLLIVETYTKTASRRTIFIITVFLAAFVMSSMTYIYLIAMLYLWAFYLLVRNGGDKKNIMQFIGISAAPYILLLIYLFSARALSDFWISNIVYNTNLYISIPNYTRGTYFNPLKFAMTLIYNFYDNYIPLITRIKHFDLYFPVALTAAISTMMLLVFLGFENILLGVIFFFILSFSAPRSNVFNIGETDYQSNVFIMLGMISAFVVFYRVSAWQWKNKTFEYLRIGLVSVLGLFMFFSFLFLAKNTYDKWYLRYTQKMPGIYNLSYTTDFLEEIIDPTDYYWVGPYEPHEVFFMTKGKLPGKFPTLLPQFREDDYFKNGFIKQFEDHPPAIIIYKHLASIFMTPADEFGRFFLDWLEKNEYTNVSKEQLTVLKSPSSFELKDDVYFHPKEKTRLIQRLKDNGYVE